MDWLTVIRELGPYFGIIFFFVWRDHRREEKLVKQNEDLNKFIREELMGLQERTLEVVQYVREP